MKPILLLDVMDTVVWDPYRLIPGFLGITDWKQLYDAKHPTAWVEFEHGRMDEAEFLRCFFADEREYDRAGLRALLFDNYRWLEGMEPLLADLRTAGIEMHALSNYPVWWEAIEERLGLSRYLDWSFVSCITGVRKPHPEAYLGPARSLGCAPGRLWFVDDRQKNVDAAVGAGLRGLRFTDAATLRAELIAGGVDIPADG